MAFRTALAAVVAALLVFAPSPWAEPGSDKVPPLEIFHYRGPDGPAVEEVAHRFEVRPVVPGRFDNFEIYVPADRSQELLDLLPQARRQTDAVASRASRAYAERAAAYPSYADVVKKLEDVEASHPEMARLEIYGQSGEHRDLYALHLAAPIEQANFRPGIMLTAATHGNELITVAVLQGMLDRLLEGYRNGDPLLKKILSKYVLYVLPVINADGYTRRDRYAQGIDPNREYPYPTLPNRTPNACIAAVMDFFETHNIVASIDYHSFGNLVMYPWSYTRQRVQGGDYDKFRTTTQKMASTAGYRAGQIPDLLYIAEGGSIDYYYWKGKTLALAIEIGNDHAPSTSSIPAHTDKNWKALMELFTQLTAANPAH